jgi:serine/threonine protein phosphatase 1
VRRSEWRRAPGSLPDGERIYAIGDIHGRLDLLQGLIAAIDEEQSAAVAARPTLVFLGDYIDRGSESRAVIDWLMEQPLPRFERVHLLGNHEDSLLRFLTDITVGPNWLHYGGVETLASYGLKAARGEDDTKRLEALQQRLEGALPESHKTFMEGLQHYCTAGEYLFVHAGIRPGVAITEQSLEDLLWIRDAFLTSADDHGHVVVHGHTISYEAEVHDNRIGIDTGAFMSNTLTCLVLEGDEYRLLQT